MFCPKCGKEIPDQAAFCPKCGAMIQAAGSQPGPQPSPPMNKLLWARRIASPTQKMADKVHIGILVMNLILIGLWMCDTFVTHPADPYESASVWFLLNGINPAVLYITCALSLLTPILSNLFLTRHMLKQDGKVNAAILSWLYLIWNAGIYGFWIFIGNYALGDEFSLTALGWLYIVCCVVLLGLLLFLAVLSFKARKDRRVCPNP